MWANLTKTFEKGVFVNIEEVLKDRDILYYAHGTGKLSADDADNKITNSVFENGLLSYTRGCGVFATEKCLGSTATCLGLGSDSLFEECSDIFKSNGHMGSKRIIVLGLPFEYIFPVISYYGTESEVAFFDRKAFFTPMDKESRDGKPPIHEVLMPEFVVGAYDANTGRFIENGRYYKKLDERRRGEILKKVQRNYVNHLKDRFILVSVFAGTKFDLDMHIGFMKERGLELPLSEDDLIELGNLSKDIAINPEKYRDYLQLRENVGASNEDENNC